VASPKINANQYQRLMAFQSLLHFIPECAVMSTPYSYYWPNPVYCTSGHYVEICWSCRVTML